nr:uncharacterized protein LOC111505480 [Leptinotarsa decemlineata]
MLRVCTFLSVIVLARAQIPSFGFCPEYIPMADFDMNRFLGKWYEAERYFQFSEVAARCVVTDYAKGPSGKIYMSNEVTNRLTGIKRVIDGTILIAGKNGEGKLTVKYLTSPIATETTLTVLDSDYDTYAVMWSCSGFGPVHAQSVWVMTRDRIPPGPVLQTAYGVLDKYKISRNFFVKTDQEGCAIAASDINAANGITSVSTVAQATGLEQRKLPLLNTNVKIPENKVSTTELNEEMKPQQVAEVLLKNSPAPIITESSKKLEESTTQEKIVPEKEQKRELHSKSVMFDKLVIISTVLTGIASQVPFFGRCPDIKTVQSFDVERYLGKWYEAERYFAVFEFGGKCVTADYEVSPNGAVNVVNQQISTFTGIHSSIEGNANQISRTEEAKLTVNFPSLPVNFDAPYWIIGTDYDNYSVVWSCNDFGIFSTLVIYGSCTYYFKPISHIECGVPEGLSI